MSWSLIDPSIRKNISVLGDRFGTIDLSLEVAELLVGTAGTNRNIKSTQVVRLAEHMEKGTFRHLTGGALLLNQDGLLAGGQHRCHAVLKTGMTVQLFIRWDQTPEEIAADNEGGIPWTAADLAGGGKYSHNRQAIAANLMIVDRNGSIAGSKGGVWTPSKIDVAENMADPRVFEAAAWADNARASNGKMFTTSGLGTIYALVKDAGTGEYEKFFHQLTTGEGLYSGDPALTVRNLLVSQTFSAVRNGWQTAFVIARAWNAFAAGEKLHKIYTFDTSRDATRHNKPITIPGQLKFFG